MHSMRARARSLSVRLGPGGLGAGAREMRRSRGRGRTNVSARHPTELDMDWRGAVTTDLHRGAHTAEEVFD